jgi:diadenosine tetraphosphate (Ap4A) HIT family hydrolase
VKHLDEPVAVEPPRHGEDPAECRACKAPDEAYIWVSERWRVRSLDRPTGLPMVLVLESRSHLDLGDLPNLLAAELGVMTVRLERAVRSLEGVARVHVNRWGDGSAHLHLWFLGRPHGRLQLRGSFLSLWDEILPPISETQWRENLALVAAWLAEFGGRPLAEPPHIDWKAPASLSPAGNDVTARGSATAQPANARVAADRRAFETIAADAGPLEPPASSEVPGAASPQASAARRGASGTGSAGKDDRTGDSADASSTRRVPGGGSTETGTGTGAGQLPLGQSRRAPQSEGTGTAPQSEGTGASGARGREAEPKKAAKPGNGGDTAPASEPADASASGDPGRSPDAVTSGMTTRSATSQRASGSGGSADAGKPAGTTGRRGNAPATVDAG